MNLTSYKYFIAFLSGVILTLAFAPFDCIITTIISFTILLNIIANCKSYKEAFSIGFTFGFGHFLTLFYWITNSLGVDLDKLWFMVPFALLGIPFGLSIYTGLVTTATFYFKENRILMSISFALIWTLVEMIRAVFPIDFPFNMVGYVVSNNMYLLQLSPFLGAYLLSTLVIIISSSIFTRNSKYILANVILLISLLSFGQYQLISSPTSLTQTKVRLASPSITDHHMGDKLKKDNAFIKLARLTNTKPVDNIDYIIWPEASFPYLVGEDFYNLSGVEKVIPSNSKLIIGADIYSKEKKLYNSLIEIKSNGKVDFVYNKKTLVAFGEFVPLRGALPFIEKIAYGIMDFTPGNQSYEDILKQNINYLPLICYEAIFPLERDYQRFDWLLNITNDAWFGNSSGPYQHFAMVRFKAAEYRMPVIRVANAGISAIIAPNGYIIDSLPLLHVGIIDGYIPQKLSQPKVRFQDFTQLLVVFSIIVCFFFKIALKSSANN